MESENLVAFSGLYSFASIPLPSIREPGPGAQANHPPAKSPHFPAVCPSRYASKSCNSAADTISARFPGMSEVSDSRRSFT